MDDSVPASLNEFMLSMQHCHRNVQEIEQVVETNPALSDMYEELCSDPEFHPDYSFLFRKAIEGHRRGEISLLVPYNGLESDDKEVKLSDLYDKLLDNPIARSDDSVVFTKAMRQRCLVHHHSDDFTFEPEFRLDKIRSFEYEMEEQQKATKCTQKLERILGSGVKRLFCQSEVKD